MKYYICRLLLIGEKDLILMKKLFKISAVLCILLLTGIQASAKIMIYGQKNAEISNAVVHNDVTMVPVRSFAESVGMEIIWFEESKTVVLWNDDTEIRAKIGEVSAEIKGENVKLSSAPMIIDGLTYLPMRNFAESINAEVVWNNGNTDVYLASYKPKTYSDNSGGKVFYSQRNSEWGFPNDGSGYCWVCAYGMIISETLGSNVTPDKIAEVTGGAYVHHGNIMDAFGTKFVKALPDNSPYFDKYESWRGATYIKADSDEETISALKAALDNNPDGILVRYTIYPHTLYAIGYEGDTIYFNESAYKDSANVTFEDTCLKKYKISDLDFIQAIRKAE